MKTKLLILTIFINIVCYAQLSGTYSIGGSNPDFTTIADVITALETDGVSGPVVFNISTGTYTEPFTITHYEGTSETNTITFQSETNDASDVIFDLGTNNVNIVELNQSDYIIFNYLTFKPLYTRSAIEVITAAKSVVIENCIFNLYTGTAFKKATTDVVENILKDFKFNNNVVLEGLKGVYLYNGNTNYSKNVEINNNYFIGVKNYPITLRAIGKEYLDGSTLYRVGQTSVFNNTIISEFSEHNSFTGIHLRTVTNDTDVHNNLIYYRNTAAGPNIIGIYEDNCGSYSGTERQKWYNNVVDINCAFYNTNNNRLTGLKIQNGSHQDFINNTFVLDGADHIYGINYSYTGGDNIIKNNDFQVLMATPFSYMIKTSTTNDPSGSITLLDHNNYYHLGDDFANWVDTDYTTFEDYKTATGFDTNSTTQQTSMKITADYDSNIYSCNNLNDLGIPTDYITTDYNGTVRDTNTPTVGAIESQLDLVLIDNNGILEATEFVNYHAYRWYLNGVFVEETTSNTYTPTANGDYYVEIMNCNITSNTVTYSSLSVNEITANVIRIYPNPAKSFINIKLENNNTLHSIILFDLYGKKIKEIDSLKNINSYQMDVSNLNKGVYFLKINTIIQKIIKI